MPSKPTFALNHMAAPRLDCRAFIDLAASLGCAGVELRNDLADKRLTERFIARGHMTRKALDDHLAALPDVTRKAEAAEPPEEPQAADETDTDAE